MLQGVRVVALTNGYAGPYAGRLLAQFGAEVIKIESMKGGLDSFRHYGQLKHVDSAPRFIECNLGVRSMTVNLKDATGVRLIKELLRHSDALLVNFRPRVLDRLGLDDESIRQANPAIVVLKLPGLGETGPKSWYGSWGFNLTAFSGMTYLWNHPGQPRPVGSQGVYPDHVGFILAPTVMVAALLRRRLTGCGAFIDLAQVEGTAYTLGVPYLKLTINGGHGEPRGNRDMSRAPHGCYRCLGEDRWCVLSVATDEQWRELCRLLGRPDLGMVPRFSSPQARREHAEELDKIVEAWTRLRPPEEVMHRLQAAGIAAGVVQDGADLLSDPQLRHRVYFERFDRSPIGSFEVPRSALKFQGLADEPLNLPAPLGRDTDSILREVLGYDQATIDRWHEEGALS